MQYLETAGFHFGQFVLQIFDLATNVIRAAAGIGVQAGFQVFDFPLNGGQAGCGGGHDAVIKPLCKGQGLLQSVGGNQPAVSFDDQAPADPGPKLPPGIASRVVGGQLQVVAVGMLEQDVRQHLLGILKKDFLPVLLQQCMQTAQNQWSPGSGKQFPGRVLVACHQVGLGAQMGAFIHGGTW